MPFFELIVELFLERFEIMHDDSFFTLALLFGFKMLFDESFFSMFVPDIEFDLFVAKSSLVCVPFGSTNVGALHSEINQIVLVYKF